MSWIIKFSWSVFFCAGMGLLPASAAEIKGSSKLQVLCEKALIHLGAQPPIRAMITATDGINTGLEAQAYHPSSYDRFILDELSYYPRRYLSLEYFAGKNILDLNSGDGRLVEELRRLGVDAVGLSIVLSRYQLSKPYFVQASATRTGLEDRSADLIISTLGPLSLFWENSPKLVHAILEEAQRVLRKGGTLLISPIHVPLKRVGPPADVSPEKVLAGTVFADLPDGLRIKNAPDREWLSRYRDAELDIGRPRRANYWLELERTD